MTGPRMVEGNAKTSPARNLCLKYSTARRPVSVRASGCATNFLSAHSWLMRLGRENVLVLLLQVVGVHLREELPLCQLGRAPQPKERQEVATDVEAPPTQDHEGVAGKGRIQQGCGFAVAQLGASSGRQGVPSSSGEPLHQGMRLFDLSGRHRHLRKLLELSEQRRKGLQPSANISSESVDFRAQGQARVQ